MRRLDRELALVVTSVVLLVAAAGWALYHFGGESLPEMRENHFILHMQGMPGTSLPQSMAAGNALARELKKIPAVTHISQQAGRAELGEDTWGVEYSEVGVSLKDLEGEEFEVVEGSLKATLRDKFPGFSFQVFSFLSERIMETISGSIAPVAVKVYGDDLADLDRAAREIAGVLGGVPGSGQRPPRAPDRPARAGDPRPPGGRGPAQPPVRRDPRRRPRRLPGGGGRPGLTTATGSSTWSSSSTPGCGTTRMRWPTSGSPYRTPAPPTRSPRQVAIALVGGRTRSNRRRLVIGSSSSRWPTCSSPTAASSSGTRAGSASSS